MEFVDRQKELIRLDRFVNLPNGALGVIWGRRRIGKTRLLLEWSQKHKGIYYVADESSSSIQRKYFATVIQQVFPGFADVEYPDWASLLSRLAHEASRSKWKGPIIIDEFPYLISQSPEFTSVFQKFIDHEAKKANLIIVLSGSSQRMMQGAVLEASAPLYGRAREIIKLGPIPVGYMKEALNLKSSKDVIESYAIWGGIPRYWELVEESKGDFFHVINDLVLDSMGPLHEEPHRLLIEESPSAIHLRSILDAIGLGANRLSEVATRIGQPVTSLVRPIQQLIDLDLIEREVPFGSDFHNSKKTLYKIKDPFVRFWFEVVAPKRSLFSQVTENVRKEWLKESFPRIFGSMWEDLCRQAVPSLSQNWGIQFEIAGRYWHKQEFEWDILSNSVDKKHLLIGEAKWTARPLSAHDVDKKIIQLQGKGIPPISRKNALEPLYVLFLLEKPKKSSFAKNVILVDAQEVIDSLR